MDFAESKRPIRSEREFPELRDRVQRKQTSNVGAVDWDAASLDDRYGLMDQLFDDYVRCLEAAGFPFEDPDCVGDQRRALVELLDDLGAFAHANQLDFDGALTEIHRRFSA